MDNFWKILFGGKCRQNLATENAKAEKEAKSLSAELLKKNIANETRQGTELCYRVVVKPSEWKSMQGLWGFVFSGLIIASAFVCRAGEENGYQPILYPSIFWHNNQWETYENGQWVPYRGPTHHEEAVEPEPEMVVPEPLPGPDMVDTNIYVPSYGWGYIGAPAIYAPYHYRHGRAKVWWERQRHHKVVNGVEQPNVGLGKPNVGIGQTTIGIGRPNVGIGQTTIGIGQPNMGIGRQNAGMGRTTIGVGQPNANVGQPTISVGQPNAGIGRATVGIGQPVSGQQVQQSRGR